MLSPALSLGAPVESWISGTHFRTSSVSFSSPCVPPNLLRSLRTSSATHIFVYTSTASPQSLPSPSRSLQRTVRCSSLFFVIPSSSVSLHYLSRLPSALVSRPLLSSSPPVPDNSCQQVRTTLNVICPSTLCLSGHIPTVLCVVNRLLSSLSRRPTPGGAILNVPL